MKYVVFAHEWTDHETGETGEQFYAITTNGSVFLMVKGNPNEPEESLWTVSSWKPQAFLFFGRKVSPCTYDSPLNFWHNEVA